MVSKEVEDSINEFDRIFGAHIPAGAELLDILQQNIINVGEPLSVTEYNGDKRTLEGIPEGEVISVQSTEVGKLDSRARSASIRLGKLLESLNDPELSSTIDRLCAEFLHIGMWTRELDVSPDLVKLAHSIEARQKSGEPHKEDSDKRKQFCREKCKTVYESLRSEGKNHTKNDIAERLLQMLNKSGLNAAGAGVRAINTYFTMSDYK